MFKFVPKVEAERFFLPLQDVFILAVHLKPSDIKETQHKVRD